jgi:hypothetical protein
VPFQVMKTDQWHDKSWFRRVLCLLGDYDIFLKILGIMTVTRGWTERKIQWDVNIVPC